MNASLAKARALVCDCAGKQFGSELIGNTAAEIYKNLVRADECSLSDTNERLERQRFQREAIVGCRLLAVLLEGFCDEEAKKGLCKRVADVRCLAAAWRNAEKRQMAQK